MRKLLLLLTTVFLMLGGLSAASPALVSAATPGYTPGWSTTLSPEHYPYIEYSCDPSGFNFHIHMYGYTSTSTVRANVNGGNVLAGYAGPGTKDWYSKNYPSTNSYTWRVVISGKNTVVTGCDVLDIGWQTMGKGCE